MASESMASRSVLTKSLTKSLSRLGSPTSGFETEQGASFPVYSPSRRVGFGGEDDDEMANGHNGRPQLRSRETRDDLDFFEVASDCDKKGAVGDIHDRGLATAKSIAESDGEEEEAEHIALLVNDRNSKPNAIPSGSDTSSKPNKSQTNGGRNGRKGGRSAVDVKPLPKPMDPMAAMAKKFAVSNGIETKDVIAKFREAMMAGKRRKVTATSRGWQVLQRLGAAVVVERVKARGHAKNSTIKSKC